MTKDYEDFVNFLKLWLDWAQGGGVISGVFHKDYGLCCNASELDSRKGTNIYRVLRKELKKDFPLYKSVYPFGGVHVFYQEVAHQVCHLNRDRITWAQKMVDYKPSRWGEFKRWLFKERW